MGQKFNNPNSKFFSKIHFSNYRTLSKMMDEEILKAVESVLGKDIEIVDCEQTKSVREEEILLINGIQVKLEGSDGAAIKKALLTGQIPPCDLLNQLLYEAGILRTPIELETSLSVKSSLTTTEEIRIARNGLILDERCLETKEDNYYTSTCSEIWEPVGKVSVLKNQNGTTEPLLIPSPDENLEYIKRNKSTSSTQIPPMRQNSVCTNDSVSNYSSSPSSSSRPTSDLSANINNSDLNLYDNIQSYLMSHSNQQVINQVEPQLASSTKLNQSLSCDSGQSHDFSLTSTTINDDDYVIPSTATQSSIASSQNSFRTNTTNSQTHCSSASSIDEVDFQKCRIKSQPVVVKLKPQNHLVNFYSRNKIKKID